MNWNSNDVGMDELVAAAKTNADAFACLYRRHYDRIFRYCVHRLYRREAAEDVTAEVFLKVAENLRGFRGDGRSFSFWLYRIATNAANQHLRDQQRLKAAMEAASARCGDGSVDDLPPGGDEEAVKLKRAILALDQRQQAIVAMRYFEGMKFEDVAEVLGGSAATVRSQLSRALASLREILARHSHDGSREVHNGV